MTTEQEIKHRIEFGNKLMAGLNNLFTRKGKPINA